jgi:hypothetical protein
MSSAKYLFLLAVYSKRAVPASTRCRVRKMNTYAVLPGVWGAGATKEQDGDGIAVSRVMTLATSQLISFSVER